MKFINATPHAIVLNDGTVFDCTDSVARVSAVYSQFNSCICKQQFGEVTGLPDAEDDTMYIVSSIVLSASSRGDLVAPATGHPECVRENGRIVSVPGFVH